MNQEKQYELMMKMQESYQQSREIEEKLQIIDQQIVELQRFEISLNDMDKNESKEMLASLGKGVFVKSEMKKEKLFVDVGAGVYVRKDVDDAKKVVLEQLKRLGELRIQLIGENERLNEIVRGMVGEVENAR
jgi:prefoldin alpha subunit